MKTKKSAMAVIFVLVMAFWGTAAWGAEEKAEVMKTEDGKWLFLCYWELNQDVPLGQKLKANKIIMESGLFPPENMEIIRFDLTPGSWGITLVKTDNVAEVFEFINI